MTVRERIQELNRQFQVNRADATSRKLTPAEALEHYIMELSILECLANCYKAGSRSHTFTLEAIACTKENMAKVAA